MAIMNATSVNNHGGVQTLLSNYNAILEENNAKIYSTIERIQLHDIRQKTDVKNLVPDIVAGLESQKRELPSLLLWNDRGLELFDDILGSQDYYPASREMNLLHDSVQKIANSIDSGDRLIELGAGNMRKTALILHTLEAQRKHIEYFALDVSSSSLQESLRELIRSFPARSNIHIHGLLGTYEDCATWLRCNDSTSKTSLLWLGNSIANFCPVDAANLVTSFLNSGSRSPSMIIAVDGCQDQEQIHRSYNNKKSCEFVLNGLAHANQLLGDEVFLPHDWKFAAQWNDNTWMYDSFYVAQRDLTIKIWEKDFLFKKNEMVRAIISGKWPHAKVAAICHEAGVRIAESWTNQEDSYRIYLLR